MYSQFAHIASDEAIKDSGVNLEKIDTERPNKYWQNKKVA